jgi:hypothetical protein
MHDLIRRLTSAPERLEAAVAGLSLSDCERAVCSDERPIRDCVEHIAVYGLDWSEMFYQAISDTYPTPRSNTRHWKERLSAEAQTSMLAALWVYRRHNKSIAEFLSDMPVCAFDHPFAPDETGNDPFVIKDSLYWGLVEHCDYHLATLHKMRVALGKPLGWMAVYQTRYSQPN